MLLLKNLLFTLLAPGTVAVMVPLYALPSKTVNPSALSALGILALGIGLATYTWCIWDFASFGKGTPAPLDPPRHLVIRGLYRYSRNPMYLGVLGVIFGWALLFQSLVHAFYGACVAVCFQLFVVFYEERVLRQKFGASYEQYCSRVGRWISFGNTSSPN